MAATKKRKCDASAVTSAVADPIRDLTVMTHASVAGLELYYPKARESWVWEHIRVFHTDRKSEDWHWVCLLCKEKRFSQAFQATSNAIRHLKTMHHLNAPNSPATLSAAAAAQRMFAANYRNTSERALVEWIITDLRPVNITNTTAFKKLWRTVTPDPLPVPATLNTRIDASYVEARGALFQRLEPFASFCSLSADGWSSPTMVPFTCVVAHFVNESWELERRCIGVNEMSDGYTGTFILTSFSDLTLHCPFVRRCSG
jgi:hypothetical protein